MKNDSIFEATSGFARCAHYGRYSTHMQRKASLDDQKRVCEDFATQEGWVILSEHIYTGAALSGTSKSKRKGLAALEAAAQIRPRLFDYVLFDDTSRLGRDLGNVLEFEKLMRHYEIKVRFVSQQLDSSDINFQMLLMVHGMVDSQYITRVKAKVHSAQKGLVLEGYNPGSWPWGYRAVRVASTDTPDAIGPAATKGTILEVVESEAEVIRRIFEMFADGYSMWKVCVVLNRENVPLTRTLKRGKKHGWWDRDTIKRMLHNEKYRGVNVWNQTTQREHPTTGQITKKYKLAHEHVRVLSPHLRIVSDGLWDRVVERLKKLSDKQEARLLGSYNRAQNGDYLYSGLLFCGGCGSRMRMGGKLGVGMYECPDHRVRRGCTNAIRIREDRVAAQITEVLANQLFVPEYLDYLVSAVFCELKEVWKTQSQQASGEGIRELEQQRSALRQKIDNLIDVIEATPLPTLTTRLAAQEFELHRIEAKLNILKDSNKMSMTKKELQELVRQNVAKLLDVLKADVPRARKLLQQHVRKLVLYPAESRDGRVFEVLGELDLFSGPSAPKGGVLLGCSGTQTPQQHTDQYYRFTMRLYPESEQCPLVEPLCQLLIARPELSLEPRTPGAWARLLRGAFGSDLDGIRPLGSGAVGRCFGRHRHVLEQKLNIIKTKHRDEHINGWHYQLSIRPDVCADEGELGDILNEANKAVSVPSIAICPSTYEVEEAAGAAT